MYIHFGYIKFTFSKKKRKKLERKELSVSQESERGKLSQGDSPPMVEFALALLQRERLFFLA